MYGASASYAPSQGGFLQLQNTPLSGTQQSHQGAQSGFTPQQSSFGSSGGFGGVSTSSQQGGGFGGGGYQQQSGPTPNRPGLWSSSSSNNIFGGGNQLGSSNVFGSSTASHHGQQQSGHHQSGGFGTLGGSVQHGAAGMVQQGGPAGIGGQDGPRKYIPGFLSSSSLGGNGMNGLGGAGPAGGDRNDEWVSTPPAGGHRATSPKAGFRSVGFAQKDSPTRSSPRGGVFGKGLATSLKPRKSDPMEEDAPPTMSLLDEDAGSMSAGPLTIARKDQTYSPSNEVDGMNPEASPSGQSTAHKIHIFGFPPSFQSTLISHFSHIGDFASPPQPSPDGGNWLTLTYAHEWAAQRAVRKNGDVFEGKVMIGVRWADENRDRMTRDNIALAPPGSAGYINGASSTLDSNPSTAPSTPAAPPSHNRIQSLRAVPAAGRPLKTYASTEAFAKPTPNDAGTPGTPVGRFLSEAGRGPNAGHFDGAVEEERRREERVAKGEGGMLTRAADFIFGW